MIANQESNWQDNIGAFLPFSCRAPGSSLAPEPRLGVEHSSDQDKSSGCEGSCHSQDCGFSWSEFQ